MSRPKVMHQARKKNAFEERLVGVEHKLMEKTEEAEGLILKLKYIKLMQRKLLKRLEREREIDKRLEELNKRIQRVIRGERRRQRQRQRHDNGDEEHGDDDIGGGQAEAIIR